MIDFGTKRAWTQILVWLVWLMAILVYLQPVSQGGNSLERRLALLGVVTHDQRAGPLFPWRSRQRWKKWALVKYRRWRAAYRRANRAAWLARLALSGVLSLAQVVDWLTSYQVQYRLGALPVLYALLETLKVRQIINRHCPTQAEVDHGTVALVLILNRLMLPLPLYQVSDWVGQTVLVGVLGLPVSKFNDDRLGRTLDALYPHLEAIWQEVVETALLKADIELSLIFYDLTAFVAHGRYANSEQVDFGCAHDTPSNKRKFKLGLNVSADGNLPWLYRMWSGRTADQATVAHNMEQLAAWLRQHGQPTGDSLIVGDRAMLNDELALAYDQHGLRHLTGLRCLRTEHQALLTQWAEEQFLAFPLEDGPQPQYWGRGCQVRFSHNGKSSTHKGLVVLAGPIRDQLRHSRNSRLEALDQELALVKSQIGQPRLRTRKAVQRRVNARLRDSRVGQLMSVSVFETEAGHLDLRWQVDTYALWQTEQRDGRYLLVTNDWPLSHRQMLSLYRQKDGVEKRFHVCKSDLNVSPIYLHQDRRIAAMLLINMLALLVYSLLERQLRQQGLQLTTRQLIKRLQHLSLIETHCLDGSVLRRLTPLDPDLFPLLNLVALALDDLLQATAVSAQPLLSAPTSALSTRSLPPLC
jgi:transposase